MKSSGMPCTSAALSCRSIHPDILKGRTVARSLPSSTHLIELTCQPSVNRGRFFLFSGRQSHMPLQCNTFKQRMGAFLPSTPETACINLCDSTIKTPIGCLFAPLRGKSLKPPRQLRRRLSKVSSIYGSCQRSSSISCESTCPRGVRTGCQSPVVADRLSLSLSPRDPAN